MCDPPPTACAPRGLRIRGRGRLVAFQVRISCRHRTRSPSWLPLKSSRVGVPLVCVHVGEASGTWGWGGGRTPGMRLGRSSARRTRRAGCHPRPGAPRQAPRCSCRHPDIWELFLHVRLVRTRVSGGAMGAGGPRTHRGTPVGGCGSPSTPPPAPTASPPASPPPPAAPRGPVGTPPPMVLLRHGGNSPAGETPHFFSGGAFPVFFCIFRLLPIFSKTRRKPRRAGPARFLARGAYME